MCKDLLHILENKRKWRDGFLLYIQQIAHMNGHNMDLDIFLEYMQDETGIQDLTCIQV